MTREQLEIHLGRLIDAAIKEGQRERPWPYQRIEARKKLIRLALRVVDNWDNGKHKEF